MCVPSASIFFFLFFFRAQCFVFAGTVGVYSIFFLIVSVSETARVAAAPVVIRIPLLNCSFSVMCHVARRKASRMAKLTGISLFFFRGFFFFSPAGRFALPFEIRRVLTCDLS